ncbi:hypothetical protein BZM27_10505 [Paraburkholderia steynii]|uniref:Uncharacterized protein n=1 Tax=Paraburkholderia steynii TaxID=1245441 RepID=A0A4R0XMX8_9BURK|nr:hypothetical protein BZM27_10505 [Paraburkholderia steynii]
MTYSTVSFSTTSQLQLSAAQMKDTMVDTLRQSQVDVAEVIRASRSQMRTSFRLARISANKTQQQDSMDFAVIASSTIHTHRKAF